MKVIKEGVVGTLKEKVICKRCHAILEITPEDCTYVVGSLLFGVTCPCCKKNNGYPFEKVSYDFWQNMKWYDK